MPMATPEAQREYQREWMAARRAKYFADKTCARCGSTENLRLDHIDPKRKVSHKIWSWSSERREAELAKCQVLCEPCHVKKTIEQTLITNGWVAHQHGTPSMYASGCHCGECRESERLRKRDYRARKRTEQTPSP